jgi:NitT/TauT family transport system permease protein
MSQIHPSLVPAARAAGAKAARFTSAWWVDSLLVLVIVAAAYGIVVAASRWAAPLTPATHIDLSPSVLPLYAGLSTFRMALAYVLSLVFSLVYARVAFASRPAERVMVPLLDILQSIPILSFLPGVVLGLVALFPKNQVGLEIAAILLIFTSQAWNMAFSFHQSLMTIPKDLREAATIYHLNFWRRFTRLEVPFGMIALIWNSMMSWAGGWFFLMAAEQFTLGSHSFQLPGLGSYLATAANAGDVGALLLGLLTLIVIIVLLDQLLWRPLIAWADRFKFEQTASSQAPTSTVLRLLRRSELLYWLQQVVFRPIGETIDRGMSRLLAFSGGSAAGAMTTGGQTPPSLPTTENLAATVPGSPSQGQRWLRRIAGWLVLAVLLAGCLWAVVQAVALFLQLTPADWGTIAVSAGATLLRTTAALVIGAAWTVPVGVAIGLNPRLAKRAQPIVQMLASIPALALFPALLLLLINLPGGLNMAAVALMLLGTQWYILFNVIAGAMAIPSDLREAAAIYKLRGWRRWRKLILPAIFPYLITGLITATGGAWNASIVSEYVTFNNHIYSTVGLGALIASSATETQFALLLAATLAMAAVVVTVNRLVWRRLYRLAEQRYHLD